MLFLHSSYFLTQYDPPPGTATVAHMPLLAKVHIFKGVTDGSAPLDDHLGRELKSQLQGAWCEQLLALRGLLSGEYALLAHVLQKRHLVDFGVNRWGAGLLVSGWLGGRVAGWLGGLVAWFLAKMAHGFLRFWLWE